jgi:hypothetical protein
VSKFIKATQDKTFKKNKIGFKVELDGKEVWATCTDAVYSYVKNNFKG